MEQGFHIPDPVPEYYGPNDFRWLIRGLLAGARRPGVFGNVDTDLEALRRVGILVLFTLTEEWEPGRDLLARHGIECRYLPIPDRHAPDVAAAHEACTEVQACICEGRPVAYHCRAGKGRTGTMLAAQMIFAGTPAGAAIAAAQRINPNWIESDDQIDFLHRFGPTIGVPFTCPHLSRVAAGGQP